MLCVEYIFLSYFLFLLHAQDTQNALYQHDAASLFGLRKTNCRYYDSVNRKIKKLSFQPYRVKLMLRFPFWHSARGGLYFGGLGVENVEIKKGLNIRFLIMEWSYFASRKQSLEKYTPRKHTLHMGKSRVYRGVHYPFSCFGLKT